VQAETSGYGGDRGGIGRKIRGKCVSIKKFMCVVCYDISFFMRCGGVVEKW